MLKRLNKTLIMLTVMFSLFITSNAFAADCKGASKSSCGAGSCSWVSGYSKKDGSSVKGYCRAKGKSGDSKDKKSKSSKSKDSKSKDSKSKDKKSKDKKSKDKKSKDKKSKDKKV